MMLKNELEEKFNGLSVIGDQHFLMARREIHRLTIHAPATAAGRPRVVRNENGEPTNKRQRRELSPGTLRKNDDIRRIRARIESPFAWIKNKFQVLQTGNGGFKESETQLDCLVHTALAFFKFSIQ